MLAMACCIYLSPHLDDGVLSCGGRIARQVRAGEHVQVVTVFAGDPAGDLSAFAQSLHQRWGLEKAAVAARREEDRAALALLGAEAVHWNLPECVYRHARDGSPLYPSELSLWGPLHPADEILEEEVTSRIARLPGDAHLYVALGAGDHVDHRLVRRAAEATGRALVYYEEYPYAAKPEAVAALAGSEWERQLFFLDDASLAARVAAVACYCSQLGTFWADESEMGRRIRAYALNVGEGRPAERYWLLAERAQEQRRSR